MTPRPVSWLTLIGCVGLVPGIAAAQREPVLKQVAVPHPYYWREMYVPQVTSGPSAVAWSPDGRDVIYSMQGALWRQPRNFPRGAKFRRRRAQWPRQRIGLVGNHVENIREMWGHSRPCSSRRSATAQR